MSQFNLGWMPIIQQELRKFFASKGSGDLANTALQPDDIGTIVQAYDQALDAASPFSKNALALANGGAWRVALGIDPTYYSRANILGAVSQSGGVPTGAAFESGSNPNGRFIKYPDGTQICYYSHSFDAVSTWSGTAGSRIKVGTWSYPAVFSETPHITASGDMSTFLGDINVTAQRIQSNSPSSAVILAKEIRAVGSLTTIVWGSYIAIGRWY